MLKKKVLRRHIYIAKLQDLKTNSHLKEIILNRNFLKRKNEKYKIMKKKTVFITGSSNGLGFYLAKHFRQQLRCNYSF